MRIKSAFIAFSLVNAIAITTTAATLRGEIVDSQLKQALPARIYILSSQGEWYFPKSAAENGTAIEYRKQRQAGSLEMHTTLSAHPFVVELPPGQYTVTVERGKEYVPVEKKLSIKPTDKQLTLTIPLTRWVDMAKRGWFSGDTHVHRTVNELPNLLLAEDLNVALPLTYWVTHSHTAPTQGDKTTRGEVQPKAIRVDPTHVIYPINTEYEIFTVRGAQERHTLGAIFVLGHREPLQIGVPPVGPVVKLARQQGAILDLDKHSWPWSLMLVPVMNVDLFELSNNHVWRTRFGFRRWTIETLPKYMGLETDDEGFTEWGWIDFGFQSYYALLNCGFKMRPSAGTASGVHPVPLGFGRVYVHLPGGFSYEKWMAGLNAGHSFVTTGPMLFATVDGQGPGTKIQKSAEENSYRVQGTTESAVPINRIEIIVNGQIAQTIKPQNAATDHGGFSNAFDVSVEMPGSGWVAVRAFESRPDKRIRFAHTAPVHIHVPDQPLRPRREEVAWIVRQIERELARHAGVLEPAALNEYKDALRSYQKIAEQAR